MSNTKYEVAEKWVDVVFVQGDDYNKIADLGVDEMAAHLTQWDYGQDTDDAHTHFVPVPETNAKVDRVYQVRFHDLEYTLNVNHSHGYAGLSRRPVSVRKTDTAS